MCYKVSYANRKMAEKAAFHIKAKGRVSARTELNSYFCRTCQAYHLTHLTGIEYLNRFK